MKKVTNVRINFVKMLLYAEKTNVFHSNFVMKIKKNALIRVSKKLIKKIDLHLFFMRRN